ncbi:RHS repeat-associated core domain-containing protein [Desulfosporosinus meridiei]|uniref:RHS repeat-associated core domain-containing protein n=1 Tax=Desulfosporosinus meridiei TaxID=79209 RepID=UPI0002313F86|nr:RHS repeat-associated core domain-containing protein [Desulfosporosinus meridiei]
MYNYLHNAHGDVIKLLNENGDVVKDYTYNPYGEEEVKGSNSFGNSRFTGVWQQEVEQIDNPFRYSGEYLDNESGLYYLRARYYDSETMRFISEDSVKGTLGDPLSLNLYTYCQGNPIKYTDPSGHLADAGGGSYGFQGMSKAGTLNLDGLIASTDPYFGLDEYFNVPSDYYTNPPAKQITSAFQQWVDQAYEKNPNDRSLSEEVAVRLFPSSKELEAT